MSRSSRVRMKRIWHHATNRGIERKTIFRNDADRQKFLELLGGLPKRFGFQIHGYVLMGNHYHLLIEDPELLISEGMKWLNLCYGMSFNRKQGRVGPVFQGRFKGVILDPEERGLTVSRYVHLNPVRVKSLGLEKKEVKAIRAGKMSEGGQVKDRLEVLNRYPWSSYRAYVGLEKSPAWLTTDFVLKRAGGREQYRKQVEREIREGMAESPWEELKWGLVLGGEKLQEATKKALLGNRREEISVRMKEKEGMGWERVVRAVEKVKGERWNEFKDRHGDSGRNLVFLLGQERGRLKLSEMAEKCGMDYGAVASGLQQIRKRLNENRAIRLEYEAIAKSLFNEK